MFWQKFQCLVCFYLNSNNIIYLDDIYVEDVLIKNLGKNCSNYSPNALTVLPLQLDDVPTSDDEVMRPISRTVSPAPVSAWCLREAKKGHVSF